MPMNPANALMGAVVADAAALGLHWLYDQARICEIAKQGPILFRKPDAEDYRDVQGYFAHAGKPAGASSQYGAAAMCAARYAKPDGSYDLAAHQAGYLAVFGPGGTYVGYADRVIRGTVANLLTAKDGSYPEQSGIDDDQMPALAAVPGLSAAGCMPAAVSAAVAMTNVNADAAAGASALHCAMQELVAGKSMDEALAAGASAAGGELGTMLAEAAAAKPLDAQAAAVKYGMPCHIKQGLPVAWHIAANAESFEQAVEANIMAGGDSCGRALAVGSLMGLAFGVPQALQDRTLVLQEV